MSYLVSIVLLDSKVRLVACHFYVIDAIDRNY